MLRVTARWQKKVFIFVAVCSLPASVRRTPPCYHGNCGFPPTHPKFAFLYFPLHAYSFLRHLHLPSILVCFMKPLCVFDIAAFVWRIYYSITHAAIHTLWWPHRQPIVLLVAAGRFPPIGESHTRRVSRRDAAPRKLQRPSYNNDAL